MENSIKESMRDVLVINDKVVHVYCFNCAYSKLPCKEMNCRDYRYYKYVRGAK